MKGTRPRRGACSDVLHKGSSTGKVSLLGVKCQGFKLAAGWTDEPNAGRLESAGGEHIRGMVPIMCQVCDSELGQYNTT
jgi:hypothetical protein